MNNANQGSQPNLAEPSPGNAEPQLGKPADAPVPTVGPSRWYSRGYLPHYDDLSKLQAVTFRLADSLPQEKLRQLAEELAALPSSRQEAERRKQIELWLDSGMGCCALRNSQLAAIVQETMLKFDGHRYRLLAWCIMPNHVHALLHPTEPLSRILQSWKSFTGRWAITHNDELGLGLPAVRRGIPGPALWMRESWDRFIRDHAHLCNTNEYIHENPVKAGLCKQATNWKWSSAHLGKMPLEQDQTGGVSCRGQKR